MKIKIFFLLFLCYVKVYLAQGSSDFIIMNAIIHPVTSEVITDGAVAVKDGKIIFTGSTKECKNYIDTATVVIDAGGRLLLPGFIDSHTHSISAYKHFFDLNLYEAGDIKEIQAAIQSYRKKHPDASYIKGRGWSNTMFQKTGPEHAVIDAVVNDIPVVLSSEDGHSKWVNGKALELAGITAETKAPPGGVIEINPETGRPTGTLREAAAGLVDKIIPPVTFQTMYDGLIEYQKMAAGFGITGIHEASLDAGSPEPDVYRRLEQEGKLRMRVAASIYTEPDSGRAFIRNILDEKNKDRGSLFKIYSAKIFADGVVEGSTAYLHEAYIHLPGDRGKLLCNADSLREVIAGLNGLEIPVHVHAIGDAATTAVLDAIEAAGKTTNSTQIRNMITHLQLVRKEDIKRFRLLGVTAVSQPYWFVKDSYYYNLQVPYLGLPRADYEYPMKSFFDAGAITASSSDYPVTIPCNPMTAIETGVTRLMENRTEPDSVLWPEEGVSVEQMVQSFTLNGAIANGWENETGSIETGKSADFIILDTNIFSVPAKEISNAKVLLTTFRGKVIYNAGVLLPVPD